MSDLVVEQPTINEQRFNYKEIQALYASEQYPLQKAVN
jgi:hypothetical protein